MSARYTTEFFIQKMKEILPELDFSKSNYINVNTKVTSTCIKHGDFENTPKMFLRGTGCFECLRESGKSNLKEMVGFNNSSFMYK